MSSAGTATNPPPVRFVDILFVDGVLDPNGQNAKHRRVVVLTPAAVKRRINERLHSEIIEQKS
jgi:hypothetical protein